MACEPECPVDAISDTKWGEKWLRLIKYSEIWPNISEAKEPLSDHENIKMKKII